MRISRAKTEYLYISGGVNGTKHTAASSQKLLVSKCYFAGVDGDNGQEVRRRVKTGRGGWRRF